MTTGKPVIDTDTSDLARLTTKQMGAALRAALKVLEKWGCSLSENSALLGVTEADLLDLENLQNQPLTTFEIMERASMLLNIHGCLRSLFSSPKSVYGWVRKPNSHPVFAGRSALEVMLSEEDGSGIKQVLNYLSSQV
tara:strand:+ start:6435 stop:6848 length:414 start_codon:yes stop_codon:yes gene_type:complete